MMLPHVVYNMYKIMQLWATSSGVHWPTLDPLL
jgi:hypothetical protein